MSVVATPLVVDLAVPSALLPNVPCLIDTVTVSVAADVVIKLPSPATLKDKPPFLLSACPVVDVLLSPVNVKVFAPRVLTAVEELVTALLIAVLTAFFTSSVVATPAVFVILPLPSVDKEPCVTLNFTTPLAATSAVVNVPLVNLKPSFKDTVWPGVAVFAV